MIKLQDSYQLDSKELKLSLLQVKQEKFFNSLSILGTDLCISREDQLEIFREYFIEHKQPSSLIQAAKIYNFVNEKDMERRKKKLYDALKILLKASPLDIISALYLYKTFEFSSTEYHRENDIELENGMVYNMFADMVLESNSQIFILYPSPFFIKKWVDDHRFSNKETVIVLHSNAEKELIKFHYEEGSYSPNKIDNIKFFDDESSYNLQDLYTNNSLILLFHRHRIFQNQNKKWTDYLPTNTKFEVFAMLAGRESDESVLPYPQTGTDKKMLADQIVLIPQGIYNSTSPRRKMLLCGHGFSIEQNTPQEVQIYSYTLKNERNKQTLFLNNIEPVIIRHFEVDTLSKSIRKLYNDSLLDLKRKLPVKTRNKSYTYEFTPEIIIHYSVTYENDNSKPRIEAYICEPDDNSMHMIKESRKHTTKIANDSIIDWLNNSYPFSTVAPRGKEQKEYVDIRQIIIGKYSGYLSKQKNISLKTLWYIYPNLADNFDSEDYSLLHEMMNTDIGYVGVCDVNTEIMETMIVTFYPNDNKDQLLKRLQIIGNLLEQAVREEYILNNPVIDSLDDYRKKDRLFAQVRNALAKKHLTSDEQKKCYFIVKKKIDSGQFEYLGVYMRLLTGLSSNILCAIRWKDINVVKDYNFAEIIVTKQLTNDGKVMRGFTGIDEYLCFPCVDEIRGELCSLKHILLQYVADKTSLSDKPIIGTKEILLGKDKKHSFYPPKNLEILSRELLASIGIQEHIIIVPDNDKGTKETNLNHYGGDFFRENFRYWIMSYSKMTEDESAYLLGNKRITTFGRYYCDYINDTSKLVLRTKLQRLSSMMHSPLINLADAEGEDLEVRLPLKKKFQ